MEETALREYVRQLTACALAEDQADEDITSQACIEKETQIKAQLILKAKARIAGIRFLPWILDTVNISTYIVHAEEGKDYDAGMVLATIEGPAHTVLKLERSLLNMIQHTSGIATLTAQFVEEVKGFSCSILDTRKTLP